LQQVFGAFLIAVGVLIAGTSGMCMLTLVDDVGPLDLELIVIVLLVGGTPFGMGVGLVYLGYRIIKPRRTD
jgi:hypothetical protein